MRQIKFRLIFDNQIVGYEKWYECQWWYSVNKIEWLPGIFWLAVTRKDQFTGLKDKNGKEIYEGDIIASWYSRDTSGKDIVATIEEVNFECEPYREKAGYEIPFLRNAEVIGNIYESPELLNENKL